MIVTLLLLLLLLLFLLFLLLYDCLKYKNFCIIFKQQLLDILVAVGLCDRLVRFVLATKTHIKLIDQVYGLKLQKRRVIAFILIPGAKDNQPEGSSSSSSFRAKTKTKKESTANPS